MGNRVRRSGCWPKRTGRASGEKGEAKAIDSSSLASTEAGNLSNGQRQFPSHSFDFTLQLNIVVVLASLNDHRPARFYVFVSAVADKHRSVV
jgi:hypothetical protein